MAQLKQIGFVKKCGRDSLGNTAPKCINPDGSEGRAAPYPDDGVDITRFEAGLLFHEIADFKEDGTPIYSKPFLEIVTAHMEKVADGRPFFIGSESDLPKHKAFRDAWIYVDGKKPKIGICLNRAKLIAGDKIKQAAILKLKEFDNPFDKTADARKEKLRKIYDAVNFDDLKSADDLVLYFSNVLEKIRGI